MGAISHDRLKAGEYIHIDESLYSKSERFNVTLQRDGNVVLYDNKDGQLNAIWSSDTGKQDNPVSFHMQEDANIVAYAKGGVPYWASQTYHKGKDAVLVMQDDGNLVAYSSDGTAFWHTNTARS